MAALIVVDGPAAGRCFPLDMETTVSLGRDDQCTFQILDEQMSRKHLHVRPNRGGDGHVAADYRSANGVTVNDVAVVTAVPLSEGDRIRLGTSTLVYTTRELTEDEMPGEYTRRRDEWKRSTLE